MQRGIIWPVNMLGVTEPVPILGGPNRTIATSPTMDVPKQMLMDPPAVVRPEPAVWERFFGSQARHFHLECLQQRRIPQAEAVFQTVRAAIPIRIVKGVIFLTGHLRALRSE